MPNTAAPAQGGGGGGGVNLGAIGNTISTLGGAIGGAPSKSGLVSGAGNVGGLVGGAQQMIEGALGLFGGNSSNRDRVTGAGDIAAGGVGLGSTIATLAGKSVNPLLNMASAIPDLLGFGHDVATGQPGAALMNSGGQAIESTALAVGSTVAAGQTAAAAAAGTAGYANPLGAVVAGVQVGELGAQAITGNSNLSLGSMAGQTAAIYNQLGAHDATKEILNGLSTDSRANDPNTNAVNRFAGQEATTLGQGGLLLDYFINNALGHPENSMMNEIYGGGGNSQPAPTDPNAPVGTCPVIH